MPSWVWRRARLSYASGVLPIFRMTLLGGVLATLALLAGFLAPGPSRPHLARLEPPARGPLLERADHPEWKQFLVQAAYRRAGELDSLRDLPADPPKQLAKLPDRSLDAAADADLTGSVTQTPEGAMPVEIGETSATELPIREQELAPPVSKPESIKRSGEIARKPLRKFRRSLVRAKPLRKPAEAPAPLTIASPLAQ